ncbi:GNAT family N-acetyltransferase [Marinobacterium jannaschii]|uniref:GNAT family N-acetyltransferase n=1 Tax=Marinobacterium jannaschii TaxID=64970 RepID=UPI000684774B|nr:GNAT family protein [Marinobacterium jannaschii]
MNQQSSAPGAPPETQLKSRLNPLGQPVGLDLDWQPCQWPPRTVSAGRFCRIEPLQPELHAEALFEAFASDRDGRNWTYLPCGPFEQLSEFRLWLESACLGDDPLFYAIVDQRSGRAVGMASYLRIAPAVGVIEVGHIHFSPLLQRTPLATEAMFLMMQRVFDELGYRRYEWKCDAQNGPSKKAARRLGFEFEGIFRQATIYKGRNRDTAWFAIIDADWPALKAGFQRWLAADNFDSAGQQKHSLQQCMAGQG